MTIRATVVSLGLGLAVSPLLAQDPPANPPAAPQAGQPVERKPEVIFRSFREYYLEGKFDVAADALREFLAANPTDSDLIELDRKFGSTFVLGLRNLPKWADNPTADAEAKKSVEQLVAKIQGATKKTLQDPKRLAMLVRNLGASPGERMYAELELKRAGSIAVPVMIEVLRSTSDIPTRTGILGALTKLGPDAVPPFIAALDGLDNDLKSGVINALAARPDLLALTGKADTDPLPSFWAYAGKADGTPTLRDAAKKGLQAVVGNTDRRRAADELVALAKPMMQKRASFWATDTTPGMIKLWHWDAASNNVKASDVSKTMAEEYFGLRALKWAVELAPSDEAIQSSFLAFATSRAVEHAKFADLNSANPSVAGLLAAAPGSLLLENLNKAISDKDAALAFGTLNAIAARAGWSVSEATVRTTGDARKTLLVRALDFPDDRVQFAAAVAILKSGLAGHGVAAKIVDILKRAASADAGSGAARAVLADPSVTRANRVGEMFRQAGFDTESVGTTKAVLQRVQKAADVDLIVIDHHASEPLLTDFLTLLRSSPVSASIPVVVVASSDVAKPPKAEALLLRLALLIAATETEPVNVPVAYLPDPRRPAKDNERMKQEALELREKGIQRLFDVRLARLERLVAACNFPDSLDLQKRMKIRLPQLTYAALAAEFPLTHESAPEASKRFEVATKLIGTQPELNPVVERLPVADLIRLVEQLENVLTPETHKKFEAMGKAIRPDLLFISGLSERNTIAEVNLQRKLQGFAKVRVIGEPYSAVSVETELKQADGIATKAPGEKAAMAKTALEWLKKMATGEVPGYDVRPAEVAMRSALKSDDLAVIVIEALAKVGSTEAQHDLIATGLTASRPAALRGQALDAAIRHVKAFGRLDAAKHEAGIANSAANESNAELKSKFAALKGMLAGKPGDLAEAIKAFAPASLEPAKPKADKKPDAPMAPMGETPPMPPANPPKD